MKIFIKFLVIISFSLVLFSFVDAREVWEPSIKNWLIWISEDNIITWTWNLKEEDWITVISWIVKWIKDTLTWFLVLVAVWAFLYIGIKLSVARWNPEEFKKAWMHLIYAIIWVFVISAAWAVVKLVAWINI